MTNESEAPVQNPDAFILQNTKRERRIGLVRFLVLMAAAWLLIAPARGQNSNYDHGVANDMLDRISHDMQKHYYDAAFHGVDWNAKVRETKKKFQEDKNLEMSIAHIAAALDSLNDSHTFLLPPSRSSHHEYGFRTEMDGDRCFISHTLPGSDAEAKGVKRGDELLAVNGYRPTRENLWKINYIFRTLRPLPGLTLDLQDPAGQHRQVAVMAKHKETQQMMDFSSGSADANIWQLIRQEENEAHLMRARSISVGESLMILKLPEFDFEAGKVDEFMGRARKYPALILDLRDNPGGSVETLKRVLGNLFDKDIKICDRAGRKESKPEIAKTRGDSAFTGKLIVLVNCQSASASELLARVVQLEKRGQVVGDRSSGSVMEARHYDYQEGMDTVMFYGASITESNLLMGDGKSLEHTGVTPDETVLPTAADLASDRDPTLSRAAAMLGVKISPEAAGKFFPFEWPKQ
jgi:C-terminal processing protease CtpA/Prc